MGKYSFFEPDEDEIEVEVAQPTALSATDAYIDFLFPSLPANENIALTRKITDKYFHTDFFADKDYLKHRINNGFTTDIFISLSTVKGEAKTKEAKNMCRRNCLGFDFDKKDFKGKFDTIYDFTKHFRNTTGLYIHFAIDSGHGYHFYAGIEETTDIPRVTSMTRRFADLSGADRSNISDAQTLRLPGTLNHKDKVALMAVNIVFRYKEEGFRRYTLDYLESHLEKLERAAGIGRPVNRKKSVTRKFRGMYPCIANMLDRGVPKGERNKCLGRIVNYFRDCARIPQKETLEIALTWNKKCNKLCDKNEQKSDEEVAKDFKRYWEPKDGKVYSLLGCVSDANRFSHIFAKYCDESVCPKHRKSPENDSTRFFVLDNRYATNECLCTLNGYSYLILKILLEDKKSYKISELVKIIGVSTGCITNALNLLIEYKFVIKSPKGVATYKTRNYASAKQHTTLPVKLFEILVSKAITEQELKMYIAIRRNAYTSKKCTYEELGEVLDIDKHTVYRTVKHMVEKELLEKELKPTGSYIQVGGTSFEKSFNYYRFPLELPTE